MPLWIVLRAAASPSSTTSPFVSAACNKDASTWALSMLPVTMWWPILNAAAFRLALRAPDSVVAKVADVSCKTVAAYSWSLPFGAAPKPGDGGFGTFLTTSFNSQFGVSAGGQSCNPGSHLYWCPVGWMLGAATMYPPSPRTSNPLPRFWTLFFTFLPGCLKIMWRPFPVIDWEVSGISPCSATKPSKASLPSSPSISSTHTLFTSPVGRPIFAFGHSPHQPAIVSRSVLASLKPFLVSGDLSRSFMGKIAIPLAA